MDCGKESGFAPYPRHEQAANNIIVPLDHPKFGPMRTVNSPFELSNAAKLPPKAAPDLGEHTREVLEEYGFSEQEIQELLSA